MQVLLGFQKHLRYERIPMDMMHLNTEDGEHALSEIKKICSAADWPTTRPAWAGVAGITLHSQDHYKRGLGNLSSHG